MKRTLTLWLVATMGFCGIASANFIGDCCGGCDCGSFEIFGEALYLQPSTCPFNFAIHDHTFGVRAFGWEQESQYAVAPVGHEHGACPDYEWGFRIGASYVTGEGCNDIRLYYSRLCAKASARANVCNGEAIWPTVGAAALTGFAWDAQCECRPVDAYGGGDLAVAALTGSESFSEARTRLEWDAIDLEVGSRTMKSCDMWVRSFIGLHWAEIRAKGSAGYWDQGEFPDTAWLGEGGHWYGTFCEKSRAWGIGPRAGFEMRYDIACGFGVTARMALGLLGGDVSHSNNGDCQECTRHHHHTNAKAGVRGGDLVDSEAHLDVDHPRRCVVIPELDAAIGINYTWCCSDCFSLYGELGWEFRNYWNVVDRTHYLDSHTAAAIVTCDDFSLQGLYLHLGVAF